MDTIKLIRLNSLIDEFEKKIGRKEYISRKLHNLLEENYKYLRPKINLWMEEAQKQIISDLTKKFIKKEILSSEIVAELTDWEEIQEDGKRLLKPAMLNIMAKTGNETFKISGLEISFDVVNPHSVAIAEKICAKLVKEVTDETKSAIARFIKKGIKEGKSMAKVAKEIRPLVGLTEKQTIAVANYNGWLIENRPEWSLKEIENSVKGYENKLHRNRAENISRTETARAQSEGTLEGYRQGGIVEKVEFLSAEGACDECQALNGKRYSLDEASGMIPVHPSCRCCFIPII
jgi:SPP1 gp7 family putative phage head morphogenesis protein